MDKNKKFYYQSRFWVWLYCATFMFYMFLQYILSLLGDANLSLPNNIAKFVNGGASLPINVLSWGWSAVVCLYCGSDRFVDIRTTMSLPSGQLSMGDLDKLRQIIMMSLIVLVVATFFSLTSSGNFELEALATTFILSTVTYTSGNKIVRSFKYTGSKDENKDGIPDAIEEEYYKWKRNQIKAGIDEKFITLEYFLDENEDLRKKLNKEVKNANKR